MPRYKLTIAYDGTNFCGWQKQEPFAQQVEGHVPQDQRPATPLIPASMVVEPLAQREGEDRSRVALRTVQHVVEQAVVQVVRERVQLQGASRTDASVHARGQVAAFSCSGGDGDAETTGHTGWPVARGTERLVRAINGKLAGDVVVMGAEVVPEAFDPVRDAVRKAYSYTIHNARERSMWDRSYVHHVYDALDVRAMQEAAAMLVGEHDFVAFAAANHGRLTTVRTVFACSVRAEAIENQRVTPSATECTATSANSDGAAPRPNENPMPQRVRIDIEGSGFLYNMVRIIAGTLVEVGRGRMQPSDIPAIIAGKDRRAAGPTLPGSGLCLEWVRYDGGSARR